MPRIRFQVPKGPYPKPEALKSREYERQSIKPFP
ncbi:uncharacterized protein G2W53_001176 [Senna tora]|uniref:Uncharacterized protein n=1 Tax=Senna tora TaxID=362788 RepID=A0A835CIC6_9FABA|nr:uncharacterized protein G2W53_001176 [Senna tora]